MNLKTMVVAVALVFVTFGTGLASAEESESGTDAQYDWLRIVRELLRDPPDLEDCDVTLHISDDIDPSVSINPIEVHVATGMGVETTCGGISAAFWLP